MSKHKFVIPRDKWIREEFSDGAGKHCALGWYVESLGGKINSWEDDVPLEAEWITKGWDEGSYLANEIVEVNDQGYDQEREAELIKLFANQDIELTFVDSLDEAE